MKATIKTLTAKSHLEVCTLINLHEATILQSQIPGKDSYGFFVIETDPETVDSFVVVSETKVDLKMQH